MAADGTDLPDRIDADEPLPGADVPAYLPDEDDPGNTGVHDPGIDRHDFASEWESLWPDTETDPRESVPELEDILRRMLVRHGYVLDDDDPAAQGDEVEILAPYASVREVADAIRDGEDVDPGDIGQAILDALEVYEALIDRIEGGAR
jgi:hypothetical protein